MLSCRLRKVAFLTFDVEPDAPPYQSSNTRGVREGVPWILRLLKDKNVKATFFVTANLVEEYEWLPNMILSGGHELASHGLDHSRLDKMSFYEARNNIIKSVEILSNYGEINSFRAPNLQLPEKLLDYASPLGIRVDSSIASYKPGHPKNPYWRNDILRIPVTATSSTIRLPLRLALKATLPPGRNYYALFYHPWEFIKIPRRPIYRIDVWIRTGDYARRMLSYIIDKIRGEGYEFALMRDAPSLCES